MKATRNAKITKDSIRAKDNISGVNNLSPAAGLRAIPSKAAEAALPCAEVPPNTAKPIAIAEPIAIKPLVLPVAAASCANAETEAKVATAKNNAFFMFSPCQFYLALISGRELLQELHRPLKVK